MPAVYGKSQQRRVQYCHMPEKFKRIGIDAAGYVLILLGIAFSPLPGPGGLPLVLAGLGLLSIHNEWARRLR